MTWANTTLVTRGSAALRTLVTWVVLIASRDGFCNPLKPNSQDYTNAITSLHKTNPKTFLHKINAITSMPLSKYNFY
jgi:hypothetical protein